MIAAIADFRLVQTGAKGARVTLGRIRRRVNGSTPNECSATCARAGSVWWEAKREADPEWSDPLPDEDAAEAYVIAERSTP